MASREKVALARSLRREATAAEDRAWRLLRNRQVLGLKFRRQKVVHGFVADFYCAEHALVLEIDGAVHDQAEQIELDRERTEALERAGIRVVRLRNEDVERGSLIEVLGEALRRGRFE